MRDKEAIKECLNKISPIDESGQHIVENWEGEICINGYCYFPIKVPLHFDRQNPIIIFDENSDEIGEICFSDRTQSIHVSSLNINAFSCFLIEYPHETIQDDQYKFLYDYVKIKKDKIRTYLDDYKKKSPIWGGYFHIEDLSNNGFNLKNTITQLSAFKNIEINRPYYMELLEQIVLENNPFNRFLKLYHLLELQFDMHTAFQIQQLIQAGGKEKEISETLRDYVKDDIERLKSLFKSKIDKSKLEPYLSNILNHKNTAQSIFYYKEKESNPLRSESKFNKLMSKNKIDQSNFDSVFGGDWFNNKIHAVVAYWIYRIRSSIAHNKLGEYMMTKNDERFIIEFAEPLIREVIVQ